MKRLIKRLTSWLLIIALLAINLMQVVVADDIVTLGLELVTDKTTVKVGDTITYTIKYSNPSTTTNAINTVIVDTLPEELDYVGFETSVDVADINVVEGDQDVVTFTMKSPMAAGKTGFVRVKAKFKEGVTTEGTTAINLGEITADNGLTAVDDAPIVTAQVNAPSWTITKTKIRPTVNPALDSDVTYRIQLTGNAKVGGLNIKDVMLTDELPDGAEFVSATDEGDYDSDTDEVSWDIGNLDVGETKTYYIVLSYPNSGFEVGDSVTNTATAVGRDIADVELTPISDDVTHSLAAANPAVSPVNKASRQTNDEYAIGQNVQYYINAFGNSGNVSLADFTLSDVVPDQIELQEVSTGAYANNENVSVTVQYKTKNITDWTNWVEGNDSGINTELIVSELGLEAGDYVTEVQWIFGEVPAGFAVSDSIKMSGTLLAIDHQEPGQAVNEDQIISNSAELSASYDGNILTSTDSVNIKVAAPTPWVTAEKTIVGNSAVYELEDVTYNLRIQNHAYATGDLEDPVLIDFFPEQLENFEVVSVDQSHASASGVVDFEEYEKVIGGGDAKYIKKWSISGAVLKPGEYIDIKVKGQVISNTRNGFFTNELYVTTADTNDYKGIKVADADDMDDDVNTTQFVKASAQAYVKFMGALESVKWVKGELDGVFTKYPEYGKTLPGGKALYRLVVSNTGSNGPISNVVVIDKLPTIEDIGVIDTQARDSAWRPYLVNIITGADGAALDDEITVYYSTSTNPSLSDISNPLAQNNTGWSTTPPSNITSVTALKFNFGDITLETGDSVTLEWQMRAPVNAPRGQIAWNSFGYGATFPDVGGDEPFLPSEPIKVGFSVEDDPDAIGNLGDFIWEDIDRDGIQENGETGIDGILVNLYDVDGNYITYTRTGKNHAGLSGHFEFPNLPAGDYTVEFVMPDNYYLTPANKGADDALDSDFTLFNAADRTYRVNTTLSAAENDMTLDAGIYRKASIGDLVWNDRDKDGQKDAGEPGIANVTVELYNADSSALVASTTTNAAGNYLFSNLDPDKYQVKVINPGNNYKFSPKACGNASTDSDIDTVTGITDPVILNSGSNLLTIDGGLYLAEIGDLIWHDTDADGVKDVGESGISGVTVKLYKDNILSATTLTNASGIYKFSDLLPGNYALEIIKPAAYSAFSPSNIGGDDAIDSDGTYAAFTDASADIENIVIAAGDRNYTFDTGLFKYAQLGDKVFKDLDQDGIQDAGEPCISGVGVKLYAASDLVNELNSATTDGAGNYTFTNLIPGAYVVAFITPAGYAITAADQGADDTADSDINTGTGRTSSITLTSGQSITTIDAGFHRARLGNYVWEDRDQNNIQNDGAKLGINGVTVKLYNADDLVNPVNQTITADNSSGQPGYYIFEDLAAGDYVVEFTAPADYHHTGLDSGDDDSVDSDVISGTHQTDVITLALGANNLMVDAGYYLISPSYAATMNEDALVPASGTVVGHGDNLTYSIETQPLNGIATVDADTGEWTYTPNENYNGNDIVSVKIEDGLGIPVYATITVTVNPVNDIPSFTKGDDISVGENSGAQFINNWATDISNGPLNEAAQMLDFVVVNDNNGLFAEQPSVTADGTLVFTPAKDTIGTANVTLYIHDNGGTDLDGVDSSLTQTFEITVFYVNQVPSFTKGGDQIVLVNSGQHLNSNWATSILPGPINEAWQSLNFILSNDNNELFSTQPTIYGNGNLFYILAPSQAGTAIVTAKLHDNGGTDNGGVDTSESQIFSIKVRYPNVILPNEPPIVGDYNIKIKINTSASGQIDASDADNDPLVYKIFEKPINGSVTVASNGKWTYTPSQNYLGEDAFTVKVSDGNGGEAVSRVNITVISENLLLNGIVREKDTQKPISNALVQITNVSNGSTLQKYTNALGYYEFSSILEGAYIIKVIHPQYAETQRSVQLDALKAIKSIITEDFNLVGYTIKLTANPTSILGDGKDQTILTAMVLDKDGNPAADTLVTFEAAVGSLYKGNTAITDSNGLASVPFMSAKLSGVNEQIIPVNAIVSDEKRGLYAKDTVYITFSPGTVQGIVIDNATGNPIEGAVVTVSKDFDGDGVVDFSSSQTTLADGRYSIAIPKGNIDYDVMINKKIETAGIENDLTFILEAKAGTITGIGNETFDTEKAAVGIIVAKDEEGNVSKVLDFSRMNLDVQGVDGKTIEGIEASIDSTGKFIARNVKPDTDYKLKVKYELAPGVEIVVGSIDLRLGNDGEMNISEILIDPYGHITNIKSKADIPGAKVVLYYANTERNRKNGKIPGSVVKLPIMEGFAPNNNDNPQYSDKEGLYAFMVFPFSDYYIIAEKEGYKQYKSPTIGVEEALVVHDIEMTPLNKSAGKLPKTGDQTNWTIAYLGLAFMAIGLGLVALYSFKLRRVN